MQEKRYPKGHFHGVGIAVGMGIGAAIGVAMGTLAVGIAVGVALGVSVGTAMEEKYNPNPRPTTDEEERIKKRNLIITLVLGVVTFAVVGATVLLR